jgi:hypothetical protein
VSWVRNTEREARDSERAGAAADTSHLASHDAWRGAAVTLCKLLLGAVRSAQRSEARPPYASLLACENFVDLLMI